MLALFFRPIGATVDLEKSEKMRLLSVDDLCSLVRAASSSPSLSGELARFALNIRSSRRHLFRQLSSDGPSDRALVAARSAALLA